MCEAWGLFIYNLILSVLNSYVCEVSTWLLQQFFPAAAAAVAVKTQRGGSGRRGLCAAEPETPRAFGVFWQHNSSTTSQTEKLPLVMERSESAAVELQLEKKQNKEKQQLISVFGLQPPKNRKNLSGLDPIWRRRAKSLRSDGLKIWWRRSFNLWGVFSGRKPKNKTLLVKI